MSCRIEWVVCALRRDVVVRALLVGLLSAGAWLSGCGEASLQRSDKTAEPDAGTEDVEEIEGPDQDLQSFAFDTSRALCEKLFECCTADERQSEMGVNAESADECVSQGAYFAFIFGYGQLDESIKEGRIKIDTQMAEMCIESIEATQCADVGSTGAIQADAPGCREVFQPQVELGGNCEVDQDCKEGVCYQSPGASASTCSKLPQKGEDCPELRCADGLYCDSFDMICEDAKAAGQPCFEDDECQSGYCATADNGDKTCGERPAVCNGA